MKRIALLVLVSCVPAKPSVPPAPAGPPHEIQGELRAGDDKCMNLCDKHRFTWATATQVEIDADAQGLDVYLKLTGPDGHEQNGDFGQHSALTFTAQPGVEYQLAVNAYDYYGTGPYTLHVTPAPSHEVLAEERPVPQPPTPEEAEPDDTLDAKIATLVTGWTASGKPVHGDLAKVSTMKWPAKRGRCYRAVIVMESGARKNDAWYLVHFAVKTKAEDRSTVGGFLSGSQRIVETGDADICPSRDGKLALYFEAHFKLGPIDDAGTGPFHVQLYEKTISGKDLDARARDEDDDYCRSCMQQRLGCQSSGDTGTYKTCSAQFDGCLRDGGMKKSQCN